MTLIFNHFKRYSDRPYNGCCRCRTTFPKQHGETPVEPVAEGTPEVPVKLKVESGWKCKSPGKREGEREEDNFQIVMI